MAWAGLWRWLWRVSRMKRGAYSTLVSHTELHRADDGEPNQSAAAAQEMRFIQSVS